MAEPQPDWGKYGPWALAAGMAGKWLLDVFNAKVAARRERADESAAAITARGTEAARVFDQAMKMAEAALADRDRCQEERAREREAAARATEILEQRLANLEDEIASLRQQQAPPN